MPRICLDAGHGGKDSGATGNGLMEKNICLALVLACKEYLINTFLDVEVITTRATDVFIELQERANIANREKADVFVSFHVNANPKAAANGFETYIYDKFGNASTKEKAERLQYAIHKAVAPRIDIADRGMKEANFAVVRETNMTALLSENGFISNAADAEKMKNPLWIQNVAIGHAEGLAVFLGLKRKPTPAPAKTAPELTDVAANSPYIDAILWAINSGVMSAINGQFGTHAPVTRAELAQILYKLSLNQKK